MSLQIQGHRTIVEDVQHGMITAMYNHETNTFIPFVDDTISQWKPATFMGDHDSVSGGDKLRNFWIDVVSRKPAS